MSHEAELLKLIPSANRALKLSQSRLPAYQKSQQEKRFEDDKTATTLVRKAITKAVSEGKTACVVPVEASPLSLRVENAFRTKGFSVFGNYICWVNPKPAQSFPETDNVTHLPKAPKIKKTAQSTSEGFLGASEGDGGDAA